MEQQTENDSLIGPFLFALAVLMIGTLGLGIVLRGFVGLPWIYVKPFQIFVSYIGFYPLMKAAVITKSGRKPTTFWSCCQVGILLAATLTVLDYVMDHVLG